MTVVSETAVQPAQARPAVRGLEASKVREVANAGFGQEKLARFWFGESDQPTPEYIRRAAIAAIEAGRTFYTHNHGIAPLREALGAYLHRQHGRTFGDARLTVTSSGVSALMVAMQALLDPGDRVVVVTPVWPNVVQIPAILGARVARVGLEPRQGAWRLDLDRLLSAITPQTRLVIVNSPGNPTGWMMPPEARRPLLDHCRRLGVWLLTDDVYERLAFDRDRAASLLEIADPEDRLISANSFSKAWLMTGWRLGWLVAPTALQADIGKLVEFNTSCAPDFVQAAGIAALAEGEPHVARLRENLRGARDQLLGALAALDGVEATRPDGGMYVMLRLAGHTDSVALAKRLVAERGLGLAPGAAFGPEAEGWLRWCVAVAPEALAEGVRRLRRAGP